MIKEQHVKVGVLILGITLVSMGPAGETFATSFLAWLCGAGLIFVSQTLWEEKQQRKDFLQDETTFNPGIRR